MLLQVKDLKFKLFSGSCVFTEKIFLNFSGNLQQVQHHSVALSPMTSGPSCAHSLGSLNNMSCGATSANTGPDRPMFDKDFECSVCLDDMRPPVKV